MRKCYVETNAPSEPVEPWQSRLSKALGADFKFKETSELVSIEKKAELIVWKNSKHTAWVEVIRVFEKDAKNPNPILFTFSEHDKQELTKLLPGWCIQIC